VSQSGSEPVTIAEAKAQLSIAGSDTFHDGRVSRLITAARQKYEYDTQTNLLTATYDDTFDRLYDSMRLTQRPVTAVTSVKYYDEDGTQQTLSTDVYSIDLALQEIRLDVQQSWPDTQQRWDSVVIRYTTGYSTIPETAKHAIMLLVAFWFEMADMIISPNMVSTSAYDSLVAVHQRSTYP
jgi:uncharacterized phiE125 gp8 family phage protein